MRSPLYCLGVGPGDPELITVKASRILSQAEIVACPCSWRAANGGSLSRLNVSRAAPLGPYQRLDAFSFSSTVFLS